jgi:hypothetical protein
MADKRRLREKQGERMAEYVAGGWERRVRERREVEVEENGDRGRERGGGRGRGGEEIVCQRARGRGEK